MAEITRRYLVEKSKVEEIRARMEIGPQTNKREIEKLVQKQVEQKERESLRIIEEQKKIIEKQRKYKMCLSKNVYDLQERLKATRQELQQTQKQLFSLQSGQPVPPLQLVPKISASQNSENGSNTSKKSNKIMHMDFDENEVNTHEKSKEIAIPSRQARYMQTNKHQGGIKTSKVIRNGMQVAKSLALARGEQKYDWLFDGEETPREQPENILSERDSARYPTINTGKKLVSSGQECVPQSDRSDQLTQTSTNNKSIINQKMKQQNPNHYEQFQHTIESNREQVDESQLILNQQRSAENDDYYAGNRPSTLKKSLNNVKSIIKKAKEGLRASGQAENIGEIQKKFYTNPFEVNHEQVQIELGCTELSQGQNWPNGQSNGHFAAYEPQKANKSLINEFGDQNPLDDDSD